MVLLGSLLQHVNWSARWDCSCQSEIKFSRSSGQLPLYSMCYNLCLNFALLNCFTAIKRTDEIPDLILDQGSKPLKNSLSCSEQAIRILNWGKSLFSCHKMIQTTVSISEAMDIKAHGSSGGLKDEEKSFPMSEGTQPLLLLSAGLQSNPRLGAVTQEHYHSHQRLVSEKMLR